MSAAKAKLEFGDYQTPKGLAATCCRLLRRLGLNPNGVLEPTCGVGNFLKAALQEFDSVVAAKGLEINREYVGSAQALLSDANIRASVSVEEANFFTTDWAAVVDTLPQPLLVVGNPPWVTNATLGCVGSENLPVKSNFQGNSGLDAVTGKSNFDISEYMLIRLSEALQGRDATLAMLCKAAVARKVMAYCWKRNLEMGDCHIFPIDALREFGASVQACLFVASFNGKVRDKSCIVHKDFAPESRVGHIGYREGLLLSDVEAYEQWRFLRGRSAYTWRSGVKHDCARVMEFHEENGRLVNGLGESVDIEDTFVYPLLKSSAIAGSVKTGKRWVLVTQRSVGDDTSVIALAAPKTWRYLLRHAQMLDQRVSTIYKGRPRFCLFGIGEYSYAPWKVVISGFYKKLDFMVVGPIAGRPVMLDDTSYFLGFDEEPEARLVAEVLNSAPAKRFLSSLIFWDAKRPITVDVLSQISIEQTAEYLGKGPLPLESKQLEAPQLDLFRDVAV
jgi:hypothetical protein